MTLTYGWGTRANTALGRPPRDHGRGRKCVKCSGSVSRYQGECRDGDYAVLLCSACQDRRFEAGVSLRSFVGVVHRGSAPGSLRDAFRGKRAGRKLPGLDGLMKRTKATAAELARETGVSKSHVERVRQLKSGASEECVGRLSRALGTEPESLYGTEEG